MDQRKRLIELITAAPTIDIPIGSRAQGKTYRTAQTIADHLLANGVIVPPCKVGDTVYMPWKWKDTRGVACLKVTAMNNLLGFGWSVGTDFDTDDEGYADKYNCGRFKFNDFGKTVFLTEEEAMRNQKNKLSWSEFKETLDDGKISEANLKAMYDAYIDDGATE